MRLLSLKSPSVSLAAMALTLPPGRSRYQSWFARAHVRKEFGTPVNTLLGPSPLLLSFAAFLTKVFPTR